MRDPLDQKFLIVVGKGGVGKSAVSAALALAAARRGKRVLVAMCNAKERLSHMLEVDPIGSQIRNVLPNLDAVNMEPHAALEEYGMLVLKVRALYKVIFENRFVSAFLRGTPGIDAWAMLGKAQYHAHETRSDGSARYDLVILDAPATGHGLDLLRVPRVIVDVAPPGPLRREAERAWSLLTDPLRSGVVLVTLAEELPANETLELHEAVVGELGLPVSRLVVNRVVERLFSDQECALLDGIAAEVPGTSGLAPLAHVSRARAHLEQAQREQIERLAQVITVPRVELPALTSPDLRRAEVEKLATSFA
jgi:anion-transporting  ArsA/GET3 family ATPase